MYPLTHIGVKGGYTKVSPNILDIFVTLEVSHPLTSGLAEAARKNIYAIFLTLEVSQLLKPGLAELA